MKSKQEVFRPSYMRIRSLLLGAYMRGEQDEVN